MLDVSFTEIVIVLLVSVAVIKPEDLPEVLGFFSSLSKKLSDIKKEIFFFFDNKKTDKISEDFSGYDDLGIDLPKIVDMNGNLQEIYDVEEVRREVKKHMLDELIRFSGNENKTLH